MSTAVEQWVEEQAKLTKPDKIYWVRGNEQEMRELIRIGMEREFTGPHQTFRKLNQKAFANSYLHRSHPNDVARTEQLTFVCPRHKDDAGPNNNWMVRRSAPPSSRCVAKLCRRVCGPMRFLIPAFAAALLQAYQTVLSEIGPSRP